MLALADGLDRARYTSAFVVAHEGPFAAALRARGLAVTVVDLRRLVSVRALVALVRHFRRVRPHLVHTAGARAGFYGRLAARLAGVPVIVSSVHTSIAAYEVAPWRRWLYVTLDRATARFAARVIATSRAVATDLVARAGIPAAKIVTIENRPDLGQLVPARPRTDSRGELGAAGDEPLIAVVARLTAQKGVADFLDALALLGARRRGWRAVVVGDGPLRAELEARAARLALHDRCRFTGTRSDLADVLAAADVLVVPSLSEGLPYVVLEAMAAGLPIVATAVGGIPDVIADGARGLLVPPHDPPRLAAALLGLLDDPARRRALGEAARRFAEAELSLDAMLAAVDAVYRGALGEAGIVGQ